MSERDNGTKRTYGGQSMSGTLERVIVRSPAPPGSDDDWVRFGYLHPIDHDLAVSEHKAFVTLLETAGCDVIVESADEPGELDAIFGYDPSLITNSGAILLSMGKPEREGEPALHARTYGALEVPILGDVKAPGTVEGGDTLWLDEQTLAVGRGYRTNSEGIEQLRFLLQPLGVDVLAYDLSYWHGPGECLHLMSLISPVAPKKAVVHLPMLPVAFVQELDSRGWTLLDMPADEFESMGCNVLALAPNVCLVVNGNPGTKSMLEAAGCSVVVYEGNEISHNRAGGPTCLTRPLLRS